MTVPREKTYNLEETFQPFHFDTENPLEEASDPTNQILLGATLRTSNFAGRMATVGPGENINAAIGTLKSAGGGVLFLRAGVHKISEDIIGADKVSIFGEGINQTIIDCQDNAVGLNYDTVTDFRLEGFTVKDSTDALGGIIIRNCGRFEVSLVAADSNTGDGFYISASYTFSLHNCTTNGNTGSGFRFHTEDYGNSDMYNYSVIGCVSESNGTAGFRVDTSDSFVHFSFTFTGCVANGNTGDGFSFEDTVNIVGGSLVGCHGGTNNWHFDIAASRFSVVSCSSSNGGQFLRTDANCGQVSIIGCTPTGDFELRGEVTLAGNNVDDPTLSSPLAQFNDIADTSVNVLGTGNGSTTTERRVFMMINNTGVTFDAGDVVVLEDNADGDEIGRTTTAGDSKVIGMMVFTRTSSAISYGHVLVEGYTKILKVDGTTDIAIGDYLTTFTTAGIAAKAASGEMVFAIALEAYTTDDSNGVIDAYILPWRFPLP